MICDCCEHGTMDLFNAIAGQASSKYLEIIDARGSENQDLVQTCIFGLGVIAMRQPECA